MHVVDIVANSIKAEATEIAVTIIESEVDDKRGFKVVDNGIGIKADMLDKVLDPFYTTRTTRRFGLGLPLLKMTCTMCDGEFIASSIPWEKTKIEAYCKRSHLDTPGWGQMAAMWMECFSAFRGGRLLFTFEFDSKDVVMDSEEIKQALGDEELCYEPSVLIQLRDMLANQLREYIREETYEIIK